MQPIEKKKRLHKIKVGMLISRAAFLKMPVKTYHCSGTFVEITEQFFITENGQPISGRDNKFGEQMIFLIFLLMGVAILIVAHPITVLLHELGHAIPALIFTRKKVTIYIGSYGETPRVLNLRLDY